jgi:hypothetical protein
MALRHLIRELFTKAERTKGNAHKRLNSGLQLRARVVEKDGKVHELLHLSRPDHPKGPSTQEAHTCAKHAGWGQDYGFRADPATQTISIWKPVGASKPKGGNGEAQKV